MPNRLTTKTRDALAHDVGQLKRDAVRIVRDVREHAGAHVDATRQRVTDTVDDLRERVTGNPLYLIAGGFALGLLFGLRLRGRGAE